MILVVAVCNRYLEIAREKPESSLNGVDLRLSGGFHGRGRQSVWRDSAGCFHLWIFDLIFDVSAPGVPRGRGDPRTKPEVPTENDPIKIRLTFKSSSAETHPGISRAREADFTRMDFQDALRRRGQRANSYTPTLRLRFSRFRFSRVWQRVTKTHRRFHKAMFRFQRPNPQP